MSRMKLLDLVAAQAFAASARSTLLLMEGVLHVAGELDSQKSVREARDLVGAVAAQIEDKIGELLVETAMDERTTNEQST